MSFGLILTKKKWIKQKISFLIEQEHMVQIYQKFYQEQINE